MENVTEMSDRAAQYHVLTTRWVSDLEFFLIESDFLRNLQQQYFVLLNEASDIEQLKDIGNKLLKLQLNMHAASIRCAKELNELTLIAENKITENISHLSMENIALEDLMINLTQEYQIVKKELFKLVEAVVRESKFLIG